MNKDLLSMAERTLNAEDPEVRAALLHAQAVLLDGDSGHRRRRHRHRS